MTVEEIAVFLLIGGAAGWIAGLIIKGTFGITGNILTGIIGAVLGGLIFRFMGISQVGPLITAASGAVGLLLIIGLIRTR